MDCVRVREIRNVSVAMSEGMKTVSIFIEDRMVQKIVETGSTGAADDFEGGCLAPPGAGDACAEGGDARRGPGPDTGTSSLIAIDGGGRLAVPGFVDVHIHGALGHSVMDGDLDGLRCLSEALVRWGITSYCPTVMTASGDTLCAALELVADALEMSRLPGWKGAEILGSHCEGPYFSRIRRGAQPERFVRDPDMGEVSEFWESSRGSLRVFSLAPELPGAREVVRWLCERGVIVAAGHSDASFEEAVLGIEAGVSQSTHTFNGMRPMTHRDPGIVCAVLNGDAVDAEVIADGAHVHPEMIRLLVRAKSLDRVMAVSDLTHVAGLPPGTYSLGDTPVELTASGAFVRGTGGLAGSTSPLLAAFNNLVRWGFSVREAVSLTSSNAARKLGLGHRKGAIAPGMDADIVVLNEDGTVFLTVVGGRVAYLA